MNYYIEYIQTTIIYLLWEGYNYTRSFCKQDNYKQYLSACELGDVKTVQELTKKHDDYDKNEGLMLASVNGHVNVVEYLIENGATNLDEALKLACKENRYTTSELLVKKGANISVGIKNATSMNIIRMLYRYDTGSDNITF